MRDGNGSCDNLTILEICEVQWVQLIALVEWKNALHWSVYMCVHYGFYRCYWNTFSTHVSWPLVLIVRGVNVKGGYDGWNNMFISNMIRLCQWEEMQNGCGGRYKLFSNFIIYCPHFSQRNKCKRFDDGKPGRLSVLYQYFWKIFFLK